MIKDFRRDMNVRRMINSSFFVFLSVVPRVTNGFQSVWAYRTKCNLTCHFKQLLSQSFQECCEAFRISWFKKLMKLITCIVIHALYKLFHLILIKLSLI